MIYVRRRRDLKKEGMLIPTKFHGHQELDEWRLAFQPDEFDNQEFNIILLDKDGEMYDIAIAIDFDFKYIKEEEI